MIKTLYKLGVEENYLPQPDRASTKALQLIPFLIVQD